MSLNFGAASSFVKFSIGNAANVSNGAVTLITLWKPNFGGTTNSGLIGAQLSGAQERSFLIDTSALFGDGDFSSGVAISGSAGDWLWLAMSKAAGSSTYRMHWKNFTTGGAWTHAVAAGAGTHTDPGTSNELQVGANAETAAATGDVAVAAIVLANMADLAIEAACTAALADLMAASPAWAVRFMNSAPNSIQDLTGGGGNETTRSGTITNTADPSGFNFSTAGSPSASVALHPLLFQMLLMNRAQQLMSSSAAPSTGTTVAIGQVVETDTAQPITTRKTKVIGQVTETDTAQAITPKKLRTIGQVVETDTAQPISRLKTKVIGQVTETDTAQPIAHIKSKAIGQVTETDTAQPITHRKTVTIGQVTETDTARAITWAPKIRQVGRVTETDTAQAITGRKTKTVGQVVETDTAQAISRRKTALVGRVTEADTAQTITNPNGGHIVAVGQVTETDTAQAIVPRKAATVGRVSETDTAQPISARKTRAIAQVVETDTAQPITRRKSRLVGQVVETDTAQGITPKHTKAIGQVTETDTAAIITRRKSRTIGQVTETDTAQSITWSPKRVMVGRVIETDTAQPISRFTLTPHVLLNKHKAYLKKKTIGGNANYIKRRPSTITGVASDGNPRLRVRRTGETYGTPSVGVPKRVHPDDNVFDVYTED